MNNSVTTNRRGPLSLFDVLSRTFDFDNPLSPLDGEQGFKVDIKEETDGYILKADLPGVKKEDLKVDFEDGVLTVTARHHANTESTDENGYIVRERREGVYRRSFNFDNAGPEDIKANFANGELEVRIKKTARQSKTSITIE